MNPLITLDDFYNRYVGSRNVTNAAGTYPGECVSLASRYFLDRFGIRTGAWGNAVDYYYKTNPAILAQFYRLAPDSPIQDGDVLVWEDDEGSFTGPDGHIAVAYHGMIINSNFNGVKRVTLNYMFRQGFAGILRAKGESMNAATEEIVDMLAHAMLNDSLANNPGLSFYIGQSVEAVVRAFNGSAQRDTYLKMLDYNLWVANTRGNRLDAIAKLVGATSGDDIDTIINKISNPSQIKATALVPGIYEVK